MALEAYINSTAAFFRGLLTSADAQYLILVAMVLIGCALVLIVHMSLKNREQISALSDVVGEMRKALGLQMVVINDLRAAARQEPPGVQAPQPLRVVAAVENGAANEDSEEQLAFLRDQLILMREEMGLEREQTPN